jgi:hypothetical protein
MNNKTGSFILLGPYLIVFVLNIVVAFIPDSLLFYLDSVRPQYGFSSLNVHTQKQMLHLHAQHRQKNIKNRVIFLGSSSVVNGLDMKIFQRNFVEQGTPFYPLNYGLTSFRAMELPFLKEYFLSDEIDIIVYLYNTFSFGNTLDLTRVHIRWDGAEYKLIAGEQADNYLIFKLKSKSIFPVGSYGDLAIDYVKRFLLGQLKPPKYDYDYPDLKKRDFTKISRVKIKPLSRNNWLRESYLESSTKESTLGYRGLQRFLQLAKLKKKVVIIAPVPEPEFADYGLLRQDIDVDMIDLHVQRIAKNNEAIFFPRHQFEIIENDDSLFKDDVHMNNFGRQEYSEKLSGLLSNYMTHDIK